VFVWIENYFTPQRPQSGSQRLQWPQHPRPHRQPQFKTLHTTIFLPKILRHWVYMSFHLYINLHFFEQCENTNVTFTSQQPPLKCVLFNSLCFPSSRSVVWPQLSIRLSTELVVKPFVEQSTKIPLLNYEGSLGDCPHWVNNNTTSDHEFRN
jgi:hypothetical protein